MKTFSITLILIVSYSTSIKAQNLIVDYQLNGSLSDSSSNSNNLITFSSGSDFTFTQGTSSASWDSAIVFQRGKGLVSSKSIHNSSWDGTSVSLWVKNSVNGTLFQGAFFGVAIDSDVNGKITAFFDGSSANRIISTVSLNDGNWHHLVCQNNGSLTQIYIDGVLNTSQAESLYKMPSANSNAKIYLGLNNVEIHKLSATVDNIKMYDDVLSECEIIELYNNSVNQSSASQNLIVDYQFNGNLLDNTSNSNHLASFSSGMDFINSQGVSSSSMDSSILFQRGKGLVSSKSINNTSWNGTAVSLWVKDGLEGTLFQGAYFGVAIDADATGKITAFFDGSSSNRIKSTKSLSDGNWHHLVCQNNGSLTQIYIDGVLDTAQAESLYKMPSANSEAKIYLGLNNVEIHKLSAYIDNFKLYKGILSECQINELYNIKKTAFKEEIDILNVALYPNPSNEKFTLSNIPVDAKNLVVLDISGKVVLEKDITSNTHDISMLPSGTYIVKLTNSKGASLAHTKLVKF